MSRRRHSDERGATMVEAALVLPLVLLLLFGVIEFGRYIASTNTVTNASREGARYAVATGPGSDSVPRYADCDGIREAARRFGVVSAPGAGQIAVAYDHGPGTGVFLECTGASVDPSALSAGDRVRVTVAVPFSMVVPMIDRFMGPTTITSTTVRTIALDT